MKPVETQTGQTEQVFEAFVKYLLPETGIISIGGFAEADIVCDPGETGMTAAYLARGRNGWQLQCTPGTADVTVNGAGIRGTVLLKNLDEICIGRLRMLLLGRILAMEEGENKVAVKETLTRLYIPEDLQDAMADDVCEGVDSEERKKEFTPMPRIFRPVDETPFVIEAPPMPAQANTQPLYLAVGPSLSMVIPMSLGLCMSMLGGMTGNGIFAYSGLVTAAGAAAAGAFWAWARVRYERKRRREREQARQNSYIMYLRDLEERLREREISTREILLSRYRDPSELCAANMKDPALWNRSASWPDFLTHRLGLGDIPFPAAVHVPEKHFRVEPDPLADLPGALAGRFRMLRGVPAGLDLLRHRLVGVVYQGSDEAAGVLRILTAQIAACNPPEQLRLVLLMDEGNSWEKELLDNLKWLPHVRTGEGRGRYLAGSQQQRSDLCYTLTEICRAAPGGGADEANGAVRLPHYIVIVSSPSFLEREPLGTYLYRQDSRGRMSTLLLSSRLEDLPNECRTVIFADAGIGSGIFHTESNRLTALRFDRISAQTLERFSRSLAPLSLADAGSALIPQRISFLAMYGVRHPAQLQAEQRWAQARSDESLRALVGVQGGGAPCYLDIHEKYHGPHGLVAGTTGSGKSEALLTWLLSLAVSYPPSDVSFFIIDYKGGGMGGMLEGLPHLAGQISNLSGGLIDRAFVSIESENRRRQKLLRRYGISRINEYTRLVRSGRAQEPMPHLLIVVDEFAELRREKPEDMQRLISVAQIGRSLGVHLILSTQRPGGVVDENIRSNARFRLCLRVQSRQDSMEMLGRPEAAAITVPGRAYLQVGGDEVFEAFQSGYCGAAYTKDERKDPDSLARMIALDGTPVSLRVLQKVPETEEDSSADDRKETELSAVIAYLQSCADKKENGRAAGLWLPPLPEVLEWEKLATCLEIAGTQLCGMQAVAGLLDDPAGQRQIPLVLSMPVCGHIAVMGIVQSGKSTLLKTLVFSVICQRRAEQPVWIYGIDCSGGSLNELDGLPCVGGIVPERDEGRIRRLMLMLDKMLEERRAKSPEEAAALPLVMILVDNYSTFTQVTKEAYSGIISRILTHGLSVRMQMLIAASGFGAGQIPAAERKNIRTVLCLEQEDSYRCLELLGGHRPMVVPRGQIPGRGLAVWEDQALEFQTAIPPENMHKFTAAAGAADPTCAVPGIPFIPQPALLEEFLETDGVRNMILTGEGIPIGYDIDDAGIRQISLRHTFTFVILGRAGSGRKNLLRVIAALLQKMNIMTVIIDFGGRMPDMRGEGEDGELQYIADDRALYDMFSQKLQPLIVRHRQIRDRMRGQGAAETEIFRRLCEDGGLCILAASLKELMEHLYNPDPDVPEMRAFTERILEKGEGLGFWVMGAASPDEGAGLKQYAAAQTFIRRGKGILLGGNSASQSILSFEGLSYREQAKSLPPGQGMLQERQGEKIRIIQIPLAPDGYTHREGGAYG